MTAADPVPMPDALLQQWRRWAQEAPRLPGEPFVYTAGRAAMAAAIAELQDARTARRARAAGVARRQFLPRFWLPPAPVDPLRRCPHDCQRAIYGDEILTAKARSRCLDCGRLLPDLPAEGALCRHGDRLR